MNEKSGYIIIVNAGGQYCHLIARRVRESQVEARIFSPSEAVNHLDHAKGIILSGGPQSVYAKDAPFFPDALFNGRLPMLGICYGHQLIAHRLGGRVQRGQKPEYGEATLSIIGNDTILSGVQDSTSVWMSHGDEVISVPPGFEVLAKSQDCGVVAMADSGRKIFGLQFHPEVNDTPCGQQILENFLFKVCDCSKTWKIGSLVPQLQDKIRLQVGKKSVLFFVSGGVDSTVAFALATSALGPDRVLGVFVDTGFMRKDEGDEIEKIFQHRGWNNFRIVHAERRFFDALAGIVDPEVKRKRIGAAFVQVQQEVQRDAGLENGNWLLGQGTIYPDTVESGQHDAALIKTHHNRVAEIEELSAAGMLLEPLIDFYKDEVRSIGRTLGLPEAIVGKNPFPGPGLAVRCLCSSDELPISFCDNCSSIAELHDTKAWRVPLPTVGVQGDSRSYNNLVLLEGPGDVDVFAQAATRITREIRGTNRVAFLVSDISAGDLAHSKVRQATLTPSRIAILREADDVCHKLLIEYGLADKVWQFPVVLLPLSIRGGETVALRPVCSSDAMTARHASLPMSFIKEAARRIEEIEGVDCVIYDVTDKPPATIEWE
jgi:GMP synthase (glutamine-hydrolysing)